MDPSLKCFLDLIAWSEGTSTSSITQNDGYDVIVTGIDGPSVFSSYTDHPFAFGRAPVVVRATPPLASTAAGRYQVLLRWWGVYKIRLSLPDFGPASQDAVAIQQITERGAVPMLRAGDIEQAIAVCSDIWASLPGNDYNQPGGRTMPVLLAQYTQLRTSAASLDTRIAT
jgi:muramidase (phage lysozyme)